MTYPESRDIKQATASPIPPTSNEVVNQLGTPGKDFLHDVAMY